MIIFDINEVVRLNLKRILKERNLKPAEFAKIIHKPKTQVSNWLSDPKKVKHPKPLGRDMIEYLCKKGNVDIVELYKFEVVGHISINKKQKTENDINYKKMLEYKEKWLDAREKNQKLENEIQRLKDKNIDKIRVGDDPNLNVKKIRGL